MRSVCVECKQLVGHADGCFLNPQPIRRIATGNPLVIDALMTTGNPLVIDALMTTGRRMTWTA